MRKVVATVVLVAWASMTWAAEKSGCEAEGRDCFQLYTACRPVWLVVEEPTEDGTRAGLTEAMLVNAGEARLRGARIYTEKMIGEPYLYTRVTMFGGGVGMDVQLQKATYDVYSKITNYVATWERNRTGTYGENPTGFIMSEVQRGLDEFIANYLRVNGPACK